MSSHNNIENFVIELALYCEGDDRKLSDLSTLFIDALTTETRPGIKSLRPQQQIEKLVMQLHLTGSSIKAISREDTFQKLAANTENTWLINKLLGSRGIDFTPQKKTKLSNKR